MSYVVDWIAREVFIPVSDLTVVSGAHYSLDMETFLVEIRRLESDFSEGLWAAQIVIHDNTRVDFAGANYAPFDDLINGYDIIFDPTAERVDLLGSNNNIIDVFISNGVSVVPSNSAGLQKVTVSGSTGPTAEEIAQAVVDFDLTDYPLHSTVGAILARSAYNGVVEVNLGSAWSGTEFPIGMKHQPVNNIPDALVLLERFHLSGLCINGDVPIPAGTNLNGVNFCSGGTIDRTITIPDTVTTNGTKFKGVILTGALNGRTQMKGCVIEDLTGIRGTVLDSSFSGDIGFDDSSGQTTIMARCYSSGEKGIPVFDIYDTKISVTDWVGKGSFANKTGTSYLGVSCAGGVFDIAATCVAGFMVFTGEGKVGEDLSGAGCLVIDGDLVNKKNFTKETMVYDGTY